MSNKNIIKTIQKKDEERFFKETDEYFGRIFSEYAYVSLAFDFFYISNDSEFDTYNSLSKKVQMLIKNIANSTENTDKKNELKKINLEIKKIVDYLTSRVDVLSLYEYVLNRLEYSFMDKKSLVKLNDSYDFEQVKNELMSYVLSSKNANVMYQRTKLLIGQLPIRITKNKLFDIIENAYSLLSEAQISEVDGCTYNLRTVSGLYDVEKFDGFDKLEEELLFIKNADYSDLSKEKYDLLVEKKENLAKILEGVIDAFCELQRVVNYAYAISILQENSNSETETINTAKHFLKKILVGAFDESEYEAFEGKYELLLKRYNDACANLDSLANHDGLKAFGKKATELYDDLLKVGFLLSDSLFVDFEKMDNASKATKEYIDSAKKELLEDLDKYIKTLTKNEKQAVKAALIENLPFGINSATELSNYIDSNLLNCQNLPEKLISTSMIMAKIEEEKNFVE